jgi:hypothetical protein
MMNIPKKSDTQDDKDTKEARNPEAIHGKEEGM